MPMSTEVRAAVAVAGVAVEAVVEEEVVGVEEEARRIGSRGSKLLGQQTGLRTGSMLLGRRQW